jgi:hypothetical protein
VRQDQLKQQRVQRVEMGGIHSEPPSAQLVVWGIHGGGELVVGLQVGDVALDRLAGEEVDALRVRAMRDVVPNLPPNALRDSKGVAVGYFIYAGLPPDHCEPTAQHLEGIL